MWPCKVLQKTADLVPLFWSILPKDKTTSFKSKRDAKKKSLSGHDHNWNTLFLGMNAVADVMADKYNTTKGSILDDASSSSLAVRMALGETQVVTETRKFLVSQGVKLDVFGQVGLKLVCLLELLSCLFSLLVVSD